MKFYKLKYALEYQAKNGGTIRYDEVGKYYWVI